jgi:hypothetical protein
MRAAFAGILFVVLTALATPAAAICSCQCIEGVARTLCSRQEEARENPSACGTGAQKVACVAAPPPPNLPERFAPPDGASDCRAQRLWDPHTDRYSVVAKVCDLDPEAVGRK